MTYKHPGYEEIQTLECGHVIPSPVKRLPGDDVYCFRHMDATRVLTVGPGYVVKCGGCAYTRSFGAGKLSAHYAADKHARKYPLHTVAVKLGKQTVAIVRPRTVMVELPFDTPPF